MKKLIMVIAVVLLSLTATFAQGSSSIPTEQDAIAAMQKGIITNPTPQVIHTIETGEFKELFNEVKDMIVWYKYKGLFYSTVFYEGYSIVVVFSPKGELVTYFWIPD